MGDVMQLVDTDIVWIDLETTGLEPQDHSILEVGCIITDKEGELRDAVSWVVYVEPVELDRMNDFVANMHEASGLLDEVPESDHNIDDVSRFFVAWLKERGLTKELKMAMAGSTIHFDKAFLDEHAPNVVDLFGHRVIDISTLKELCVRLNPEIATAWKKISGESYKRHRALSDLRASIAEYQFYIENFLFVESDFDDSFTVAERQAAMAGHAVLDTENNTEYDEE